MRSSSVCSSASLTSLLPTRLRQRLQPPAQRHFWVAGAIWAALVAFPFVLVYFLAPAAMVPLPSNATTDFCSPDPTRPSYTDKANITCSTARTNLHAIHAHARAHPRA